MCYTCCDFGFYDQDSIERISSREFLIWLNSRKLKMFTSLLNKENNLGEFIMRAILFYLLIAILAFTYQNKAIAADAMIKTPAPNVSLSEKQQNAYDMCYQTDIRMIKNEVLKTDFAHAELVVKNFCTCVVPYVDEGYKAKFTVLFSCMKAKSKDKKLDLANIDPTVQAECKRQSDQEMVKIAEKMKINCKSYQDEFNKIVDLNKPCGGGACNNHP